MTLSSLRFPTRPHIFLAAVLTGGLTPGLAATPAVPGGATGAPGFTGTQALLGQRVFTQNCQGCHGAQLQGVRGPALRGTAFLAKWATGQRPLADLHGYLSQKMPRNKPGSLSAAEYLNVTAFVLSRNGYVPGPRTLTARTLNVPLAPPPATAP